MSEEVEGGVYFKNQAAVPETFSSGCQVFDSMLGGGYAENRIINIVGDSGSAKTGLAIEACANFHEKYPNGHIHYTETEAAFDISYAEILGMPVENINFPTEITTVEDVFKDMSEIIEKSRETGEHSLYIIDSLDALSDDAEMEREIDKDSYGASKAKKLSELFRRLTQQLEGTNVTVIVVSQVRDNMNSGFGAKKTRAGGKALEFYCTQIVWLARLEKINKQVKGEKRPIGTKIKAQCTKNKIGPPFREVEMKLYFNYGIDDLESNAMWLNSINKLKEVHDSGTSVSQFIKAVDGLPDEEFDEMRDKVAEKVVKEWNEIESQLAPRRSKYRK